MLRRRLNMSRVWLVLAVLLLIAGSSIWRQRAQAARVDECKRNLQELVLAVEKWQSSHTLNSIDHVERYPEDFSTVVKDGFLEQVPLNPYTKSPVRELKPGERNELGNFRYVPRYTFFDFEDHNSVGVLQDAMLILYVPGKGKPSDVHPVMLQKLGPENFLEGRVGEGIRSWKIPQEGVDLDQTRSESWDEALKRADY
jgi:hypothetical protein